MTVTVQQPVPVVPARRSPADGAAASPRNSAERSPDAGAATLASNGGKDIQLR